MTAPPPPLLLDTIAFIFWHADSLRRSATARAALLEAPQRAIYVSAASAFEISPKVRLPKLTVPPAILTDFAYVVEGDGFRMLDVDAASAIRAGVLQGTHRDPFDRLICAQALILNAAVVTNDPVFSELGVEVFW